MFVLLSDSIYTIVLSFCVYTFVLQCLYSCLTVSVLLPDSVCTVHANWYLKIGRDLERIHIRILTIQWAYPWWLHINLGVTSIFILCFSFWHKSADVMREKQRSVIFRILKLTKVLKIYLNIVYKNVFNLPLESWVWSDVSPWVGREWS